MWHHATGGKGQKDMVVLPYKDRLLLFSRYLQQLVMESLGKRLDLNGKRVDQGIARLRQQGLDRPARLRAAAPRRRQQLLRRVRPRAGGRRRRRSKSSRASRPGDYLHGFLLGTREALFDNDRQSMTITVPRVDARTVGVLIALFERAVGFYALLVGINAYHQPGVEAGKKAAAAVLALQAKVVGALSTTPQTAEQIAGEIGTADEVETVYLILDHLAANGQARATDGPPDKRTFHC